MYALTGDRFADQRDVRKGAANGDELCKLALDVESYRVKNTLARIWLPWAVWTALSLPPG